MKYIYVFIFMALCSYVAHTQSLPKEYLVVNTNKSIYIPGEELLVAVRSKHPETDFMISQMAYIQLLDEKNEVKLEEKIALSNDLGSAQIYLPSHLKTGAYRLLAYTRWMKNLPSSVFSDTPLIIINPFEPIPGDIFLNHEIYDSVYFSFVPLVQQRIGDDTIQTIQYAVKNRKGQYLKVELKITNQAGEELYSTVSPSQIGIIDLPFKMDQTYTCTIVTPAGKIHFEKFQLPVLPVISVTIRYEGNQLVIDNPNEDSLLVSIENKWKYMDTLVHSKNLKMASSQLPKGTCNVKVMTPDKSLILQKFVDIAPAQVAVSMNGLKPEYEKRDTISFSLASKFTGFCGISVTRVSPIKSVNVGYQSHYGNSPLFQNMDNDQPHEIILPDYRGELISGSITDVNVQAVPNFTFYLTATGDHSYIRTLTTDQNGDFSFFADQSLNLQNLIFSGLSDLSIQLQSSFSNTFDLTPLSPLQIDSLGFNNWLLQQAQIVQIKNSYDSVVTPKKLNRSLFTESEHVDYWFDEYTRFATMEDHIVEYISELVIKKSDAGPIFSIRNIPNRTSENGPVFTMLNGIKCTASDIIDFDPKRIELVEIFQKQFQMGNQTYAGAVNFITFDTESVKQTELPGWQPLKMKSFNLSADAHIFRINHMPDYRTDLLWIPHVTLSEQPLQFQAVGSDVSGSYAVTVSGFEDDEYVSETFYFTIK